MAQQVAVTLVQAAALLKLEHSPNSNGPRLTPQQLAQLGTLLEAADDAGGNTPVKRLLGLLTLVNLMWLAGIAGTVVRQVAVQQSCHVGAANADSPHVLIDIYTCEPAGLQPWQSVNHIWKVFVTREHL
jgi:hypothetical protein